LAKKVGRLKKAKKCCKHCQDYKFCKDRGRCCEYCDFYINAHCTYTPKKKGAAYSTLTGVETKFELANYRGDDYGIDDYSEYEDVE